MLAITGDIPRDEDDRRAVVGRAPMRSTPRVDDLPGAPEAGEFWGWGLAYVEPQGERRAQAWLWMRGRVRTWVPSMPRPRAQAAGGGSRTLRAESVPLLRGYLLVPAMYLEHALVLAAPGIHRFMMHGDWPVLVRDSEFDALRAAEKKFNDQSSINPDTGHRYTVGEAVRFVSDLIAVVLGPATVVEAGRRLVVETSSRRRITIEHSSQIEPVSSEGPSRHG